jgi:hypothetical protein
MLMKFMIALPLCAALVGCGMYSSNVRLGNQQSMASLHDQHEAALTVQVYPSMPPGSTVIGPVDAARCHRFSNRTPPTDDMVLMDLKIAAYAQGANGITGVSIQKKSGLTSNCWHILDGRATAVRVPIGP